MQVTPLKVSTSPAYCIFKPGRHTKHKEDSSMRFDIHGGNLLFWEGLKNWKGNRNGSNWHM